MCGTLLKSRDRVPVALQMLLDSLIMLADHHLHSHMFLIPAGEFGPQAHLLSYRKKVTTKITTIFETSAIKYRVDHRNESCQHSPLRQKHYQTHLFKPVFEKRLVINA